MTIGGLGSGTAFPAILPTSGTATADIGEMSRPPTQANGTKLTQEQFRFGQSVSTASQ